MCIQCSRKSCTMYSTDCNLWNLHVFTSVLSHYNVCVTNTTHFQLKILKIRAHKVSYKVLWKISTWTVVNGVLNNLHKPVFWKLFKKLEKTLKKSSWRHHRVNKRVKNCQARIWGPGSRIEIQRGELRDSSQLLRTFPDSTESTERLKGWNEKFTILVDLGRKNCRP